MEQRAKIATAADEISVVDRIFDRRKESGAGETRAFDRGAAQISCVIIVLQKIKEGRRS
jgi:hypothetical protein